MLLAPEHNMLYAMPIQRVLETIALTPYRNLSSSLNRTPMKGQLMMAFTGLPQSTMRRSRAIIWPADPKLQCTLGIDRCVMEVHIVALCLVANIWRHAVTNTTSTVLHPTIQSIKKKQTLD